MSRTTKPEVIEADNLSLGWAKILLRIMEPGGHAISPLMFSLTGFDADGAPTETPQIRQELDEFLTAIGKKDVENVAFTIFPQRYLTLAGGDRHLLYRTYLEAFPRIKAFNPARNSRGLYFQRLIDYHDDGKSNQLEWMIEQYNAGLKRRSMFQASIFDPSRDPTSQPYMEFPCLQGISFTFDDDKNLTLNAFYATQQIIHKGYGNYLGLSRLGAFMAKEMGGRKLERLNVFVGIAKADKIPSSDANLRALLAAIRNASEQAVGIEPA
ncbi:thymidylate synthase [Devosia sediminis]|uniref:Thymidylate synthase n=1 Tax=Devosia sediminis TaxID=2798801 RepID=A0A934J0Z8_9HYPH|nr:thymidylate synthase [Devosia sediminis]MBJ3785624.1 thymidylate synthase [Devosia sediminis]